MIWAFNMMAICFFALLGVIATLFVSVDLFRAFYVWQSRIHIGRWNGFEQWRNAVSNRSEKWLYRMPVVPKRSNERLILLDMIRGDYANQNISSWQAGGLILGYAESSGILPAKLIRKFITLGMKISDVECGLLAYSLLKSKTDSKDDMKCINEFARHTEDLILEIKGANPAVPYRKDSPDKLYVDTLGFICPFLCEQGCRTKNQSLLELAEKQIIEYRGLFHPTLKLPPHAYDTENNCPLGVYDWGRGIGWYIFSIVECCNAMSGHGMTDNEFYATLVSLIVELSQTMMRFQKRNGGYSMFVADPNGQYESSVTALCSLLYVEAYKLTKNTIFLDSCKKDLQRLMKVTKRTGEIDLCQGDTMGIGLYSNCLSVMPFVQGIALMSVERYGKNS